MNRRLRNRHRWLTTSLAIVVPAALAAAILARPTMPVMEQLPDLGGLPAYDEDMTVLADEYVRIDTATMRFALLAAASAPERYAVEIRPQDSDVIRGADVLVYWWKMPARESETVPVNAHLLGRLAGTQTRRYALPAAARPGAGRLVFYSLGQRRLIEGEWPLPTERASR